MEKLYKWLHSAAGHVSIALLGVSLVLILLIFSTYGETFLSIDTANTINNILIGIATGLIGIIITVVFVQYAFDKQDEDREKKDEIMAIKRYDKYMKALMQKYFMFYIPVTTRIENRHTEEIVNPFEYRFKLSDMADMYLPSLYLSEGFSKPAIVLFFDAEERLREYMLRMLENVDFKYNKTLEKILLDFVTKSVDFDVRGSILDAPNIRFGNEHASDVFVRDIKNEQHDWLAMFQSGKLKNNAMLPYVLLYYNIQDQMRLLHDYNEYVNELD